MRQGTDGTESPVDVPCRAKAWCRCSTRADCTWSSSASSWTCAPVACCRWASASRRPAASPSTSSWTASGSRPSPLHPSPLPAAERRPALTRVRRPWGTVCGSGSEANTLSPRARLSDRVISWPRTLLPAASSGGDHAARPPLPAANCHHGVAALSLPGRPHPPTASHLTARRNRPTPWPRAPGHTCRPTRRAPRHRVDAAVASVAAITPRSARRRRASTAACRGRWRPPGRSGSARSCGAGARSPGCAGSYATHTRRPRRRPRHRPAKADSPSRAAAQPRSAAASEAATVPRWAADLGQQARCRDGSRVDHRVHRPVVVHLDRADRVEGQAGRIGTEQLSSAVRPERLDDEREDERLGHALDGEALSAVADLERPTCHGDDRGRTPCGSAPASWGCTWPPRRRARHGAGRTPPATGLRPWRRRAGAPSTPSRAARPELTRTAGEEAVLPS